MTEWKLRARLHGDRRAGGGEDLTDGAGRLDPAAPVVGIVVMAVVLALVFRTRLRLVPLGVSLAAVAITFGLMSLLGA